MGLTIGGSLRLATKGRATTSPGGGQTVAFVGAGGKTTSIFALAREEPAPVVVTSTTHFGIWQASAAERHTIVSSDADIEPLGSEHVTLITGPVLPDQRTQSLDPRSMERLHQLCVTSGRLLLVEADGSRQRPLKAPTDHEPSIPEFADLVVVVAGLGGLGQPLSEEAVHRPEIFSRLSGLEKGTAITGDALVRVLTHPIGGVKAIPAGARRVALLNQADTPQLQAAARRMVDPLLSAYDSVVIAQMQHNTVFAAYERCAGIVLAGGASARFGKSKQLLDWRGEPFVHAVARTALAAGLSPVVVITGADGDAVATAVQDLSVLVVKNLEWREGQASSIRAGVGTVPSETGSAIFLLADQPQATADVIRALVEAHAANLDPIVAPLILEERRGNPVLFDRATFGDLLSLRGDVGGRAIFDKHQVRYLPWHDANLLLDIDTPEDYRRLLQGERT